jgi:hypothetical protein
MLEWLFHKNSKKAIAKRAVRYAQKVLRLRRAPDFDAKVDYLFWYGAVDIDPHHCVVWIILSGPESQRLPAMLIPTRDKNSLYRARDQLSVRDREWLEELIAVVEGEFRACGWEWQKPTIGIESAERVKRGGGFSYFR